jgi:NADH dehydrogenase
MNMKRICIPGGCGFVGRHLANRLASDGYHVRILTRHPERHRELAIHPRITLHGTDVHDPGQLRMQFDGIDTVINLVGILNDPDRQGSGFHKAHVELPRKVVQAALDCGVQRLLHMSALNADPAESSSLYLKTKGAGEELVHSTEARGLVVTSLRPSVIFGPDDSFFNRFATLLQLSPLVFPLACPRSQFAPVYVGDVVEVICRSLHDATGGERLELCGPEVFTLQALVEYTRDQIGAHCKVIGLGDKLSRIQAHIFGLLPGQPFTMDNYYSLQRDSICRHNALPTLGISPTPVAAVVPGYLAGKNSCARYHEMRRRSGRNP